jgi:lysozyme family protein
VANFDVFLPLLLKFEGGFVNDPADPGGATNKGITLQTFRGCAQNLLGLEPTLDNLKSLTDAQAGAIYRDLYWNKTRGDDIDSQTLANIVCDSTSTPEQTPPNCSRLFSAGWAKL